MGIRDLFRREPDDLTAELMKEAEDSRPAPDPHRGWSGTPTDSLTEAVQAQLAAGKTIDAIKTYREATGVGLKEAKDAVDSLAAGSPLTVPEAVLAPAPPPGDAQVETLVAQDRLIDAIKVYRAIHGVGLKEAKDAVDAIKAAGIAASESSA
jgi:ribosomal protein L7/L12